MAVRSGVGATLASAVVFSLMLMAQLVVLTGAEGRERLVLTADLESMTNVNETVLAASRVLEALDVLQGYLTRTPLNCSTAVQSADAEMVSMSSSTTWGGIVVSQAIGPASNTNQADNMTILSPFNGLVAGMLGVRDAMSSSTVGSYPQVTFHRYEVHEFHLPVKLGLMASFCLSATSQIDSAVHSFHITTCNATAIDTLMDSESGDIGNGAEGLGVSAGLRYNVLSPSCRIVFMLRVEQEEIPGPLGEFAVTVEHEGAASQA